ncbi:MAG: hypothetical protein GXO40_06285 [Epsilonproteobacteria bacterium]|nr:hypothetical protein [Campylobacterota bacterium]
MRYIIMLLLAGSFALSATCQELMQKYHTPDPSIKTMKQLKRWVRRKMKHSPDKDVVLKCLIDRAADNPNQATVAGG